MNDEEVQRFVEYLQIPSVHPDVDYSGCVSFLKNQAAELGLPVNVTELVAKKPVVVITWEGTDPQLPSILLNSHMDVVPVYEEFWNYPPFDAVISDGFIYARGTQDMKSVGMMHLEAVRRLKEAGTRLKRTVHVCFVPDEEIGGVEGMGEFAKSDQFKKLNVGFGLDESMPVPSSTVLCAFHGERTSRQIIVTSKGNPGHGSLLLPNTAGEKLHYMLDKLMKFRAEEKAKVDAGCWLGDVTTVNLTQLQGGVQINVLPESLSASFDIRVAPQVDHEEFEEMITRWCKEAGEGVTFEYVVKNPEIKFTDLNDLPFWDEMNNVVNEMGYTIECVTCPGVTDARYVRQQGIPAIGFSPIPNCERRIHAHNERIPIDAYKQGIDVMEKVVQAIANVN